ncbi:multicopper oxidase domain-containing protein [Nonomuraea bangladeshensis]|uniref:Multicopper oxidase domain-containing protein n=1 Tax=Nonomuraea bangladeshensis TaxID=404385 RepID=A0ABV3GZX7_9ACTN
MLLRLINSSEEPQRLHVGGTPYTVTAIDGNPVQGATPLPRGTDLLLAAGGRFDVAFTMPPGVTYVSSSIDGRLYPAVPMLMVTEGDRLKMRIVNRSLIDHPMHLHGHRVRVLSRNGVPATGSAWWTDTLNIAPGEIYEIAFTADNPGVWMDHCHNFRHGSQGMIMHLGYTGVGTPYTEDGIPE